MPRNILPEPLARLLQSHSAAYATHYPPSDNSDHGPMAYLAMHGLGIGYESIEAFADGYRRKLVPAPPPKESVSADRWTAHIGRRESYSALLAFFNDEIARHGWEATVARYLPSLISGWVKDAFHPLIRLGYGIEFEAESEIAAGLAYLTITGDDARLALLAKQRPTVPQGRAYLQAVQAMRDPAFARGPFNSRYRRIMQDAPLAPDHADATQELSRACLEAFHATHDFFALHLVTSSHAFRVCAPWAGANTGELFSVGIAAAYLAIGAPQFDAVDDDTAVLPIARLAKATDEHDIKLAYSSRAQAEAYGDSTYEWVAVAYLSPRLPANG
jgi:hypothetical protein